ncbi:MAG: SGNH/GDSL hydrolase family protein [Giesbergeria sp.]|nr:SGNH/GDSL hydrolase family protein [Giesbergeria sp.]
MITHSTPKAALSALFAACLLAACGGSDDALESRITAVKVVGDSLSDSGTYGFKFTVQGTAATGAGSTTIWPEYVAANYRQTLCAHYASSNQITYSRNAACGNYAVAAARINHVTAPTSPLSITQQLKDAGSAGFSAGDLLLIDGGANDLADLVGAYLGAASDGGQAYGALLSTVLDPVAVRTALGAGAGGLVQIGAAYAKTLAVQFASTIQSQALAKGATRVAVLNSPAITKTPEFQMILGSIAAAGGANGAQAAAAAEVLFDGWVKVFNAQLADSLAGDARVVVVDFYASMTDQVANPAKYQITNATTPTCPVTGVNEKGLPTYTFPTCTAASLSAMAAPQGASGGADWWKSYGFADGFHPTPYFHKLMGDLVSRSLVQAGWR